MKTIDSLPVSEQPPGYNPMPVESRPHSYTYIPVLYINYNDIFPSTSRSVTLRVVFASSFELQFVPLCHFPPCNLHMYITKHNLHWLTKQDQGAKNINCNLTKIILSLNEMKICCVYNSNICNCEMHRSQIIKKKITMFSGPQWQALLNSEMNVHFPLKLGISWLDKRMSAFQGPCSTGKLSTAFCWTVSTAYILPRRS